MAEILLGFRCFNIAFSERGIENTVCLKVKAFEMYLKPKLTVLRKLFLDWSQADLYTCICL